MTESSRLVFVWLPEHVEMLPATPTGEVIVALERGIEYLLEERNLTYVSVRTLREGDPVSRMIFVEDLVKSILGDTTPFVYRNIPIAKIASFPIREYLNRVLYYTSIFDSIAKTYPGNSWRVYVHPGPNPPDGGALVERMQSAIPDAAELIAHVHNISYVPIGETKKTERSIFSNHIFTTSFFRIANICISLLSRRKKIRLVVDDYWRNIVPVVKELPDAEITLLDRKSFRHISFSTILQHRLQFVRLKETPSRQARQGSKIITLWWREYSLSLRPYLYKEYNVLPLLVKGIDTYIEGIQAILSEIDGAYALLASRPTAVLLRTSTGGQSHFSILALVAHTLSIRSIEVQHGLEYLGKGSVSGDHTAATIAVYGKPISTELQLRGYAQKNLIDIGSPRFDTYAGVTGSPSGSILIICPDLYIGGGMDSYEIEDFFSMIFQNVPKDIEIVVKLRSSSREAFFRTLLERAQGARKIRFERDRPLASVLSECRFTISCYSTAILESLACTIPSIMLALSPFEQKMATYHFTPYREAGAMRVCDSAESLRHEVLQLTHEHEYQRAQERIRQYMEEQYSFDGKSSKRLAQYLEALCM